MSVEAGENHAILIELEPLVECRGMVAPHLHVLHPVQRRFTITRQVTLDEAQMHLPDLVEAAKNGETIIIKQNDLPVVKLVAVTPALRHAQFGSAAGLLSIADDFDTPIPDLAEYTK